MRLQTVVLAGLATAALWVAAVAAQSGAPPTLMGRPERPLVDNGMTRVIGALLHAEGLTAAQRHQLHAIMEADRSAVDPLLADLRTANQDLADQLLAAAAPSPNTVGGMIDQIETLRTQLLHRQQQTVESLRSVLSADQIQQAAAHSEGFGDGPDMLSWRR